MSYQPKAVIVGAGPNGLTAAARLTLEGWSVDIYEQAEKPGGSASSNNAIFADTIVDLGAASHPFGVASPAFQALHLEEADYGGCGPPTRWLTLSKRAKLVYLPIHLPKPLNYWTLMRQLGPDYILPLLNTSMTT